MLFYSNCFVQIHFSCLKLSWSCTLFQLFFFSGYYVDYTFHQYSNGPDDVTIRIYTLIGRFSSSFASFKLGRSLALCFRTFDATTPAILTFFKGTQTQNDLCPRAGVIEDKTNPAIVTLKATQTKISSNSRLPPPPHSFSLSIPTQS